MTRTEEIKKAADELYKDSEYPVPNIYCFMKGAEWADNNPLCFSVVLTLFLLIYLHIVEIYYTFVIELL